MADSGLHEDAKLCWIGSPILVPNVPAQVYHVHCPAGLVVQQPTTVLSSSFSYSRPLWSGRPFFLRNIMKLFSVEVLSTTLLLASSVNAALTFDASCNTKYGSLTAKQLISKSMDVQPKIAKAGKDGLDTLIEMLEYQSKAPGAKKPNISKGQLDTMIATYRVLFGDISAKNPDGTDNPNFKQQAAEHIAAIKVTRDSLARMTSSRNPNLMIHCNDDWLSERAPKGAVPKPTAPLTGGAQYFYDTDRKRWTSVRGGKPCQGNKAAVTSMNKKGVAGRETGQER